MLAIRAGGTDHGGEFVPPQHFHRPACPKPSVAIQEERDDSPRRDVMQRGQDFR
jgi:hypothetical protein